MYDLTMFMFLFSVFAGFEQYKVQECASQSSSEQQFDETVPSVFP